MIPSSDYGLDLSVRYISNLNPIFIFKFPNKQHTTKNDIKIDNNKRRSPQEIINVGTTNNVDFHCQHQQCEDLTVEKN